MLAQKPEKLIQLAVRGMLAEGILGHRQLGKLKIYKGGEHPHIAQLPQAHAIIKK
jgi:large subunit ribosomal protein L13